MVLIVGGCYVIYKGIEWVHDATSVQDQFNALCHNANISLKEKLGDALQKMQAALQLRDDPQLKRNYEILVCQHNLQKEDFSSVVQESTAGFANPDLDAETRKSYLSLRLAASAGMKDNLTDFERFNNFPSW